MNESNNATGAAVPRARRIAGPTALVAALLVLAAVWPRPHVRPDVTAGPAARPDPRVIEILGRLDFARSLRDVRRLSGAAEICARGECGQIPNRLTGSPALALSMDYVADELDGLGYAAAEEPWSTGRLADHNLILRKTGAISPTEEVYVVAHVDGVGSCPGPQCPGADDNASGTVAAMELARAFEESVFARSVVILFTTGEEQGAIGAKEHIARLSAADLARIRALVNTDMLGFDSNDDNAMELYYGDHEPSLALARDIERSFATYAPALVPRIDPGCG